MPDVSVFNVKGTKVNVKDATARTNASSAQTAATNAQSTANTANATANANKAAIANLEKLSRTTVDYDSTSETISFTDSTHSV